MFGAFGRATGATSLAFVSQLALDAGRSAALRPGQARWPRCAAAAVGKRDMKLNDALPRITVDAETYVVTADGEELRAQPADVLPLAQRYFLF